MVAKLLIDYRETTLLNNLTIPFENRNLEVGDVQFLWLDNVEIIIERKSVSDLNNSISDGRYSEQKMRLCSNYDRNRIVYIIEGIIPENNSFIDSQKVYSGILHTMFRDNIHIYRTQTIIETAQFITEIWNRFSKKTDDWLKFMKGGSLNYAMEIDKKNYDKVGTKKSENNTPQIAFINMLGQIPGCSTKMAEVIQHKFNTPVILIEAFHSCPIGKGEQLLKDLQLENRKLGPVLSRRIYNYFFGITTES